MFLLLPICNNKSSFFTILCAAFLLGQLTCVASNGEEGFYPNDENCGMTDESEDDIRTFNPWNVVIYIRKSRKSPFEYFLTGTLANANTVITGFGGGFGQTPYKDKNKRYFIPPPSYFLIAAGLKSTNLADADEHTQFANVSYISPNAGNTTNFHLVVFRLDRSLNIETPYVRSSCQFFVLLPFFRSIGFEGNFEDIIGGVKDDLAVVGGFNAPPKSKGPFKNTVVVVKSSLNKECLTSYKYNYKKEPEDAIHCLRLSDQGDNNTCLSHGSGLIWKSTNYAISFIPALGPEPRYFYSGTVGLIPRRDLGHCGKSTVYYAILIHNVITWLKDHMLCENPQTYPCNNSTCIPLHQLCDEKPDCPGAEDEDPVYCLATKRCRDPNQYQCGYEGKCIPFERVGDGIIDCPSGSDEDQKLLQTKRFQQNNEEFEEIECPPLYPTEGVQIDCGIIDKGVVNCSKPTVGTVATFRCAKYYASLQKTNFANMKCFDDGTWRPYRSFLCQPDCGIIGSDVNQALVVNGIGVESPDSFPWHAAVFKEPDSGGDPEYICGASLIERNVLVTSGHCTTDRDGNAFDVRQFRIVFNSVSSKLSDNMRSKEAQIFQVEQIWRPYTYNADTQQSDIAIIKLTEPVTYTQSIKPICYISKKFNSIPGADTIGTVPGFGVTETGFVSKVLKYINLKVVSPNDCRARFYDNFCAKSVNDNQTLCNGDSGGGLVFTPDNYKFFLKGIVSYLKNPNGYGCELQPDSLSVFTHLDSHTEWLLTTLEEIDVNP